MRTHDELKGALGREEHGRASAEVPRAPAAGHVTLPERTLRLLAAVDKDRARAVVKVTDAALAPTDRAEKKLVELAEVMPGVGIIVVGASRCLRQIPWLGLVEVTPARFLLSIPSGTPVESLEIALDDLLREAVPPAEGRERAMLEQLHALMRTLRRGRSVSKAEMLFVDTGGRPCTRTARSEEVPETRAPA